MKNPHLDIKVLYQEVELLRRQNPEMDFDKKLFADMVEGSTSLDNIISGMVEEYFNRINLAKACEEKAKTWKERAQTWKALITRARAVGHIHEKQTYPLGTVFESRERDDLLYNKDTLPDEYWTVDEIKLRKNLAAGEKVGDARLVRSNLSPRTVIRTK